MTYCYQSTRVWYTALEMISNTNIDGTITLSHTETFSLSFQLFNPRISFQGIIESGGDMLSQETLNQ